MFSNPNSIDYIDNQEFSKAVHDYNVRRKEAEAEGKDIPIIPDYIGQCFMQMSEGMAKKPNFNRYTYKDEMIADGIENCIRYIYNYDMDKQTRTGNPNAFYYFSQIIYYAFIRRIKKENKQTEIKNNLLDSTNIEMFIESDENHNNSGEQQATLYVEDALYRRDTIK